MTAKEQKLYSFYTQCFAKGYLDMTDDTQSLKAKVIASDLGLRYGKIAALLEEARGVYEAEEKRKAEEAERAAAEALRASVPGKEVLSLVENSNSPKIIHIFRRPDDSIYCTIGTNDRKYEGAPDIEVRKGGVLTYTYHPSKTVFTGASSGGIAMGGTHQTEAYYTERSAATGKGDIRAKTGDAEIWVKRIELTTGTVEAFKRDETFNRLRSGNSITCIDTSGASLSRDIMGMAVQSRAGMQDTLAKASMAVDMMRLPMAKIQEIAGFLNDAIAGNYPPTDEEYYARAMELLGGKKSEELKQAVEIFKKISDYKDSATKVKTAEQIYEDLLQSEKEQKILEKEANDRKRKKYLKIAAPVAVLVVIAGMLASNSMKKQTAYNAAEQLLEDNKYDDAAAAFEAMNGYKDSEERIKECRYQKAGEVIGRLERIDPEQIVEAARIKGEFEPNRDIKRIAGAHGLFDSNSFKQAYADLNALGDYKDCEEILDCLDKETEAVDAMYESFVKAAPMVRDLPEDNELKKSLVNTIEMYEPYTGTFYWMNSQNMKFESDFILDPKSYGVVRWSDAQITVKMDGKDVPYPLVVLDGKKYGLLQDLEFNALEAEGNINDLINTKVVFHDGIAAVDMYYRSGNDMKLGDTFYACSDDPASKEYGENYYKSQNESVKMDLAQHYYRCYVYGKTKSILDGLPDSAGKASMLSTIEPYLPYLGTWEFVSGDAALLKDDYANNRTEVNKIQTETARVKNDVRLDVFEEGATTAFRRLSREDNGYVLKRYTGSGKNRKELKFIISVTEAGNLLVTEEKDGKRFTAEYRRTGEPGEGTPVVLTDEAKELEAKRSSKSSSGSSSKSSSKTSSGSSYKASSGSNSSGSSSGSYSGSSSGSSNNMRNGYDMPNSNDKSFSDYVKRVDPELYNEMQKNYNDAVRGY